MNQFDIFVNIKNNIIEIIFYSPVDLVNLNDVNPEELAATEIAKRSFYKRVNF